MSNAIERTCVVPHHAARRLCVIRITPVIGATGIHLLKILLIKSRRNPTPTGIFIKTPFNKKRMGWLMIMYSNSLAHILPSTKYPSSFRFCSQSLRSGQQRSGGKEAPTAPCYPWPSLIIATRGWFNRTIGNKEKVKVELLTSKNINSNETLSHPQVLIWEHLGLLLVVTC